jgi:probable F420-dependent oxidoreductase
MRIGAVFPQTEIGADPAVRPVWAETVEHLGYRHVLAYDHVLGAGADTRPGWTGYTSETSFHEVFVLFGFLAAVTSSLELVTGVLVLPHGRPWLVAKQAAEVDVLSGGRCCASVSASAGIRSNTMRSESLSPIGALAAKNRSSCCGPCGREPKLTYSGRWHQVDNAGIKPRPASGTIPIWIGGNSPAVLRRTGRMADGWFPQRAPDQVAREMIDQIRDAAGQSGRAPERIGLEPRLSVAAVPRSGWAEFASGWRDLGATHLCVNTMGLQLPTLEDHLALLADVIDVLKTIS